MPESGRTIYATHVGRVSKVVDAPLRYVFEWLTDYRSTDGKFSRSRPRFRVVRLSKDRIVRIRYSRPGTGPLAVAIELVRLRPPNAWHVDQIDEADLDSVDYKLTRLGPKKTRISLVLVERWMVPKFPAKSEWVKSTGVFWGRLVDAIEEQYQKGVPARG